MSRDTSSPGFTSSLDTLSLYFISLCPKSKVFIATGAERLGPDQNDSTPFLVQISQKSPLEKSQNPYLFLNYIGKINYIDKSIHTNHHRNRTCTGIECFCAHSFCRAFMRSGTDVGQKHLAHNRCSNTIQKVLVWLRAGLCVGLSSCFIGDLRYSFSLCDRYNKLHLPIPLHHETFRMPLGVISQKLYAWGKT